jgi:hypothetical protein
MRQSLRLFSTLVPAGCLVIACADYGAPAAPSDVAGAAGARIAADVSPNGSGRILLLDQCDPDSFNEAIAPGTCVDRNGGITFERFIALLQKHARVPSWRFSPSTIHVAHEVTLPIANKGGEVHTFTEVDEFGGGIVPDLNDLSGTPVPAPECLTLAPGDFIPAGGESSHTFTPGEAAKYMCCIHPWMRAETR